VADEARERCRERDGRELGHAHKLPPTVVVPNGHFLSWQPGRDAYKSPAGLPWTLDPNTDLLVQLHMQPTVLASYRVLDLTDESGFLCGKILADLAVNDPAAFASLVETAKSALPAAR